METWESTYMNEMRSFIVSLFHWSQRKKTHIEQNYSSKVHPVRPTNKLDSKYLIGHRQNMLIHFPSMRFNYQKSLIKTSVIGAGEMT